MRKKTILCALTLAVTVGSISPILGEAGKKQNKEVKKKTVLLRLSAKKKTVYQGRTFTIKCKGTKQKIHWKLSKKSIVTVKKKTRNSIQLKAKKTGCIVLTASYKKKKSKCRIVVKKKNSFFKNKTQPILENQENITTNAILQSNTLTEQKTTIEETSTAKQTETEVTTQTGTQKQTEPEATTQETSTPKQTEPEVTTQETTTEKQTEAEATMQETSTPKQTEPEATTQETTTEKQTEAEATTQETSTPKQTEAETTTEQTTTQKQTETESSSVHAVLEEEAKPVTAEDLAHRDHEAQQEIHSSFESPTYSGDGTFYGGGYRGGCCNLDTMTNGYYICAMNRPQYNTGQMSGAYIELTGPMGTLKMLVADELPEGKYGDIDMNTIAFPHVAKVEDGRVPVTWKIIPFPTDEPIKYWIKKDSTEYWMQIQVRNHRYPIQKLELKMEDGTYKEVPKRNYNFFEIGADGLGMPGKGPYTFRVTDIYGQVLEDTIPLMPGYIIDGKKNFEY